MANGRVAGRAAVVSEGARGMGKAAALRLAEEEAGVMIIDMLDEAEAVAAQTRAPGGRAIFVKVDLTDERQVEAGVAKAAQALSDRIDILVNNAAIPAVNKLAHEIAVEEWNLVFDINVNGSFLMSKHVLPLMIAQESGSIVNSSSIYGLIGGNDLPAYHATKGEVLMMTKTNAICYVPYGIRVNGVRPGSATSKLFVQTAKTYPAGADAYLASDEARFVTGTNLVCDGGYTAQ